MEGLQTFFDTTTQLYLLGSSIVLLVAWIIMLELRLRKLLRGKNAQSLESVITDLVSSQKELHSFRSELEQYLENVEHRLGRSIQSVETIRFNPFKGTGEGGNQSFATAFVDEKGNGVMLSSIYSRDRVSIFAKPVENHSSSFDLSKEEQDALKNAQSKIANH